LNELGDGDRVFGRDFECGHGEPRHDHRPL
jgi:hypothetical protein